MANYTINRKLKRINTLQIKTAVVVATADDFLNSKHFLKDFPLHYVHGVIVYDLPYTELCLISKMLDISPGDTEINAESFRWVDRKKLLTLQEISRIRKDRAVSRLETKRSILIAELKSITRGKDE